MVDLLILVEPFVQVRLARATAPEEVPLVRLCVGEMVGLHQGPDKFGVPPEYFVEQVVVHHMVVFGIAQGWRRIVQQLLHSNGFESQELVLLVMVIAWVVGLVAVLGWIKCVCDIGCRLSTVA